MPGSFRANAKNSGVGSFHVPGEFLRAPSAQDALVLSRARGQLHAERLANPDLAAALGALAL
jgi:hypothetical protein